MIYSLYRVSFEFNNRTKSYDRYFMASSESDARKWFLGLAYKEMKLEAPMCDQLIIPTDYNSVTAYYKKEVCMKVELHYLPSRLQKVSSEAMKKVQFDEIIDKFSEDFPIKKNANLKMQEDPF